MDPYNFGPPPQRPPLGEPGTPGGPPMSRGAVHGHHGLTKQEQKNMERYLEERLSKQFNNLNVSRSSGMNPYILRF